ncbi:MAG: hypothetical protein ACLQOO_35235 [Terriglobia bacterium]
MMKSGFVAPGFSPAPDAGGPCGLGRKMPDFSPGATLFDFFLGREEQIKKQK